MQISQSWLEEVADAADVADVADVADAAEVLPSMPPCRADDLSGQRCGGETQVREHVGVVFLEAARGTR